ncbi:MAG: exodeoxyribonuclease V subunit beta, partial [Myxococcota bacterium]|nr:exodeoxyribonuclease V subunit beta [Myxococcota bacterium]
PQSESDLEWLVEALRSFDQAAIFTIHGFCQRALQQHAFEIGRAFESELVSDSRALFTEVAQDFWVRELYTAQAAQVEYAGLSSVSLGPGQLAQLAEQVAMRPDIEVRPARRPVPDLGVLEKEWRSAFDRVAPAWASDRDEVLEILATGAEQGQLHKGRYKRDVLHTRWRSAMDAAMRHGRPGIQRRFKQLPLLSASRIANRKGQPKPVHGFFDLCDSLLRAEEGLEEGLSDWATNFRHDFVAYARTELVRRKDEREILFFDDLLQGLRDALAGERGEQVAEALRLRHPVALIDEFQDTDPIQYEIFRRVWHGSPDQALFLVGDPKQAIYGFRGADLKAYLDARSDAADAVHGLRCNRRADPGLVEALNAVFGSTPAPFGREEIPYPLAEPRADVEDALSGECIQTGLRILWKSPRAGEEEIPKQRAAGEVSHGVAAEVARLLSSEQRIDGRSLVPRDIAVLTRTNQQARSVQAALRERGIVAVLQSGESVFATDEAEELERVIRAMLEPDNPAYLRAALATTLLGDEAGDLLALAADGDGSEWADLVLALRECRRTWLERSFVRAFRGLWVQREISARLLRRADGERRVTNLLHLGELLHAAGVEARLGPQALLHWFGRRRREAEGTNAVLAEDAQLRLESDAEAVQLVTVHRSKGLQYPVTVCPFLWEGIAPRKDPFVLFHDSQSGELVLDAGGSDESKARALEEAHEERLRLAYVALTRARHHCSVVWGRFKDAGVSPLAHLLHPVQPGEKTAAARLKERSDEDLRADLDRVVQASSGHIVVEEWEPDLDPAAQAPQPAALACPAPDLAAARADRRFARRWRVSSFSGLVSGAPEADEGRDYDARSGRIDAEVDPPSDAPNRVALADFPAGALPGILIHEIFEKLDFGAADELPGLVERELSRHGFADHWCEPLSRALRDVLSVPLEVAEPASHLGALPRSDRIDEMEFMLPVAGSEGGLGADALGRAFAEHATTPWVRQYAERAAVLGFPALSGHLRGFIDLVLRRGGCFSVVDYKSNRLGPSVSDYAPEALQAAMVEHDYVLQYHLYLVALHRHLQLRLPDYDYDKHVGGAAYLFVRGMSSSHPPGWGIVHDRPPRRLIESLSELLE